MRIEWKVARWLVAMGAALIAGSVAAGAQSCTTQSRMQPAVRTVLADTSMTLAKAVQAGDAARVQSMTVAEFAASQQSFAPTADLVHSTSAHVASDTLRVTQLYVLDGQKLTAGPDAAEFSCLLAGSTAETDFAIPGLAAGTYAFSMVEATGAQPYLLAFLLRQDAGVWKLAGFYPRARSAAGHDGAWYWKTAYDDAKAKQVWLGWLLFGEADQLLRPANFATSTKLDSLRAEQKAFAPAELANGLSSASPLVLKAADGGEFRFTSVAAEASGDGTRLELILHLKADWLQDSAAAVARNQSAAKAFVDAHPEVRQGIDSVVVFAEAEGYAPVTTEQKMSEIP